MKMILKKEKNKKIFVFTIFFILMMFVLMSVNILISDFKYAHKSHRVYSGSFDWFSYRVELVLLKVKNSLLDSNIKGLPPVYLYISEKNQKKLLGDIPISTKKWVKGYFLLEDKVLRKIKVRHRGDNPVNWFFEKKSWRIKTKKNELFDRTRVIEYIAPQNSNYFHEYLGAKIANSVGVLSPKVRLIELFINNKSTGIHIETEKLNESFLRRNKIMPVNLYKGEQYNTSAFIGVDLDLFNNPGLWTKVAFFNQMSEEDKIDLAQFLSTARNAESDSKVFDSLFEKLDIDEWSKFAAYQIMTQNYHNDSTHNIRMVIDRWTGNARPISHDADYRKYGIDRYGLEHSSHSIMKILNRSSVFIHEKYNKLFQYIAINEVLRKEAEELRNMESFFVNSSMRDEANSLHTVYIESERTQHESRKDIEYQGGIKLRQEMVNMLEKSHDNIINDLHASPKAYWRKAHTRVGVVLSIDGEIPVSNIRLKYGKDRPKWVAIDENNNNIVDRGERIFNDFKGDSITMPVSLYANRISITDKMYDMDFHGKIVTANTGFNIISENNIIPNSLYAENKFSKSKFVLENKNTEFGHPNMYNVPVYHDNIDESSDNVKVFSGDVLVEKDLVITERVLIKEGTRFKMRNNASIIFKDKVMALGEVNNPIVIESYNKDDTWGTIAILGRKTSGSIFRFVNFEGGSGGIVDGVHYTSMFAIHNAENVLIDNIKMKHNKIYDDMLHIVYGNNITISNVSIFNANSDAIDIDMSENMVLRNITVANPGNDAIDFMESEALIECATLYGALDKAISAGENSNILIYNSNIHDSNIGVAAKDRSKVEILYSKISNNKTQLDAYEKNWRYGGGGDITVSNSWVSGIINDFKTTKKSEIVISDSIISGNVHNQGNVSVNKKIVPRKNNHPMIKYIESPVPASY